MKKWGLLAILFLLAVGVLGQNTIGLPRIVNFSKTEFHGGAQTWDIRQDARGQMYFANNEGLITFDGAYWKLYPLPNKTIMRSLALDSMGRIYSGGQGEMGYFRADGRGVLKYTTLIDLLPANQRSFADIWDIEVLNGAVYFRATDRIFQLKENSIQVFPAKSEWVFMKAIGSRVYAQDKQQGLYYFNGSQWIPLRNNQLLGGELVAGLLQVNPQGFFLASLKGNFFRVTGDSLSRHMVGKPSILKGDVYIAEPLNEQEFVLGTTSSGCVIMDLNGHTIQQLSRREGLQNNNVLAVFRDREQNLWTGLNNGISYIAYNAAIKYISPVAENELAGFSARVLNNQLYVATSDGAYMVRLDPSANKDLSFSKGEFIMIANSAGQAWRLDEVNQQVLMGHNSGTFIIRDGRAVPIAPEPAWLFVPLDPVVPSPRVLVGNYTGLKMLGYGKSGFTDLGNLKGIYESLRFLAIDNDQQIWASHPYRGIYQLRLSADGRSYEAKLYNEKNGLPSTLGNHVFKVKNRMIFATEKGPYEFDRKSGRFIPSPVLSPILQETPLRYLNEDADGNIWFCSGKQLGVVSFGKGKDSSSITYFPELTGQILSGFESVYPFDARNIFIASEKGIILLNFEKYKGNRQPLGVLVGQVKAFGKADSVVYGGYDAFLQGDPVREEGGNLFEMPYRFNSFHFEYSCPAYGMQNTIEYSYFLEGYDADWGNWSGRTERDYTNLPEGSYVFKVKARTNLGQESEVASYPFKVLPPWYRTIWAYIVYALLLYLLFYLVNRWQKRNLYLQRLQFEERQRQINTLHQLEMEKNEKEIIKLQKEKLENEVKYKNKELADTTMHLVERSDAIAKVKDELQRLYKASGNNNDIKRAIQLLGDIERNNSDWERFAASFDEINNDFLKKLKSKYPMLTNTDLKLCAYLQLNLSSKEIAQLMNISLRGVEISRYRLRKKLDIPTEQNLADFLKNMV
ncbi:hypothetical protein KJS94_11280 [Flavihumibacter rivuli]|uniref:helix-turn-helix and ligand-binding sensor domain-containing protein n=1 Tax=Flavihumibacter rivuli TaxID=2838156 RepID=UPI001BDF01C6|nr:triple tyrosine motif-containing protein [Flavihumibacter rivuli]ULQ55224.1 hypothetical protein KJS94_11280 [Flavihumibacter rivuli]